MSKESNAKRRRDKRYEEDNEDEIYDEDEDNDEETGTRKFCMKCGYTYYSDTACPNCSGKGKQ